MLTEELGDSDISFIIKRQCGGVQSEFANRKGFCVREANRL